MATAARAFVDVSLLCFYNLAACISIFCSGSIFATLRSQISLVPWTSPGLFSAGSCRSRHRSRAALGSSSRGSASSTWPKLLDVSSGDPLRVLCPSVCAVACSIFSDFQFVFDSISLYA